jgi:hypothetical protein
VEEAARLATNGARNEAARERLGAAYRQLHAANTRAVVSARRSPPGTAGLGEVGRDEIADERDRLADERERIADERERTADERDRVADQRERTADERIADQRERSVDQREQIVRESQPY